METETQLIPREKRFEVADLTGLDAIVSRADSGENLFFAQLIDFSRTGVKFTVPFFAKFDEFLKIEFKFKNSSLHYAGTGRVRHIRNVEPNRWQVGCSIDPPVPDDVVAYMVKTTNQERRRFERVEVEGQGSLLRQGTIEGCDANLINVSEGGLCLSVDQEHETGQRVDFRIENQKGSEEIIAARVRWQSSVEGGYRLGCSFADSTSHTKLVDCLVEKQHAIEGDRVNWLVAAAIMFAMFLPPATYFLFGTRDNESRTDTVNQIAAASSQSASELSSDPQTESNPAVEDSFAIRTNKNHNQQDSINLPTDTIQKIAASHAPVVPPASNRNEELTAKLASGKRDSRQEPDFRQPWGEPPVDIAAGNKKSGTTDRSPRNTIAEKGRSPLPNATPETSKPIISKSEIAKSEIAKPEIAKSNSYNSAFSKPAGSESDISSPLPIVTRSQPKPPLELLTSGSNKTHVFQAQSANQSATSPNAKVSMGKNSKVSTRATPKPHSRKNTEVSRLIASVAKPQQASTRRLQKTQLLQVPSEVISDQRSGH